MIAICLNSYLKRFDLKVWLIVKTQCYVCYVNVVPFKGTFLFFLPKNFFQHALNESVRKNFLSEKQSTIERRKQVTFISFADKWCTKTFFCNIPEFVLMINDVIGEKPDTATWRASRWEWKWTIARNLAAIDLAAKKICLINLTIELPFGR
jgi:hypothetical protein